MVSLRLRREGTNKRPYYKVVAADSRAKRDGRFIETIGSYDPKIEGENFKIDLQRVDYWLSCGAQPSETVASIIRKARRTEDNVAPEVVATAVESVGE